MSEIISKAIDYQLLNSDKTSYKILKEEDMLVF